MKIYLFTLITILLLSFVGFGQDINPCKEADSPIIQGLRLDDSFTDVKKDSKLKFVSDKKTAGIYYVFNPNKNVFFLMINVYKNHLSIILVSYSNEIKWNFVAEFRQQVIDSLSLSGTWKNTGEYDNQKSTLSCENFNIDVDKPDGKFRLIASSKVIAKRRHNDILIQTKKEKELQEKKKETFRP